MSQFEVSTHSRPKAAGAGVGRFAQESFGFNSQPPEGGWHPCRALCPIRECFNSQPPEGGWPTQKAVNCLGEVSTHSRPKAAGAPVSVVVAAPMCFNSQPPEGGWLFELAAITVYYVSTHSRPKAAGCSCEPAIRRV